MTKPIEWLFPVAIQFCGLIATTDFHRDGDDVTCRRMDENGGEARTLKATVQSANLFNPHRLPQFIVVHYSRVNFKNN